ncbi:DEAD/DEAH box helicase [Saccharophagus degradans]|uniref:ATP-dependent RNA helicase DeaD n=1 Tax=Saccharophagus degradans TaxID=86304 RepID=A0AAW7X1I0_9GAMM|nr:DEAD/DEAH box helicase [Saccharophagus degradans]MBU2985103.1 DEAD/DEAH box helicase [Saccharophagus degradans]MDO6421605.1 DEAD/DEAH box helicase [Saccharophagus degradans]MDO6608567.1 DEAD/DEAH box helicase [Saccharophagus degradans]WGO99525.1 DEAD/DEAH box helicase [Saccharophagus degradans]
MTESSPNFAQLGLNEHILKALTDVGYETPSPIQAKSIPELLAGRDILGQAQTGTGKTAAFALPILNNLDLSQKAPQVLVLAPTRELAIQVAEAFQSYAHHLPGFHILPIYGGQGYDQQIRALKRGVHVIVGTPGRVMDHMRKGTLKLDQLKVLVLDEADEMLRMGFIDDVEWVLTQTPPTRQIALFSATMPKEIAKVANKYLNDPALIKIEVKTQTADTIRQRYWGVSGHHKLDATTRILEAEEFDAMIIFVRTKTTTIELAEKLAARGYSSAALNGDISQNLRERTVEKLKKGQIDILVATDVAARGLDVDRISHVLNYDIPYDSEAYVHRIGRTGRAGRSGEAILFVAPREMRMLRTIEKATRKPIELMKMPSTDDINQIRVDRFKQKILDAAKSPGLEFFRKLVTEMQHDNELDTADIAAALALLYQGDQPLLLEDRPQRQPREFKERDGDFDKRGRGDRDGRGREGRDRGKGREKDENMETYRIEVGRKDGVKPGDIVGAIANEANISSKFIGHIKLHDDFSTVDLPSGMPKEVFETLSKTWVCQKQLRITRAEGNAGGGRGRGGDDFKRKKRPANKDGAPRKPRAKKADS